MCSSTSCCHGYNYVCTAASITTNIDGKACQGEEWVLTCTGQSTTHRWRLETAGSNSIQITYTRGDVLGTTHEGLYYFTLVSASNNGFESTVSTVLTNAMNNTVAECSDTESKESEAIRIAS